MSKRLAMVVWGTGLVVVGLQALALAARYFHPWLSADYLYPQLFAEDVLSGHYPLSGWTLSSAPYFFPDMAAAITLRALGGPGPVLPAYLVLYYVLLAVAAGWALERATDTGWSGRLGGVVLVNGLLACQPLADHAHYLWLLGTLGFHGGAMLLGLVNFALWSGEPNAALERGRQAGAVALLGLGLLSDTLFLTQMVLPLGAALWLQAGRDWRKPRMRAFLGTLAVALAFVVVVRLALAFGGWFSFSKVLRYAPTPSAIAGAAAAFVRDASRVFAPNAWAFVLLAGVGLAVTGWEWWRWRRAANPAPPGLRLATDWALLGLAATTLLPIATVYWRNEHHARYVLPWLVFPGWLLLARLLTAVDLAANGRRLAALAAGLALLGAFAVPRIQARAVWAWPYPARQAQLDEFIRSRGLRHGLSDYWHAHEVGTLSHAGVHLFPLRPGGRASFWNNNAFQFYVVDGGGSLGRPDYTFIITDGLDEPALLGRFGEPAARERVGESTVWLYDAAGARRLTQSLDAEVREFLRGRPGVQRLPAPPP